MAKRRPKVTHYTVTMNGTPCAVYLVTTRRRFYVALPSEFPEQFTKREKAERLVSRTENVAREIRCSILRDWIVEKDPKLAPLARDPALQIVPHRE